METPPQWPRRRLLAVLTVLAVGFGALFIIPFYVPVKPVISASYVFGFSNRTALAIFIAFAAFFAYWSGGLGLLEKQPEEAIAVKPMSRKLLFVTLAITAGITVAIWLAFRKLGAFNEAGYQFDRLQLLASNGVSYRDFEYLYGPILLYFPLLLHKLFRLSLLDAYFVSWIVEWLIGVFLIWLTIAWVSATTSRRDGIYLLVFLGFIFATISMGTQYTPLRFIAAPFFAALSWRVLRSTGKPVPAALVALAGAAWTLFYSPEQGLAFIIGTLAFFVVFLKRRNQTNWASIALFAAGATLLLWLALRLGVFAAVRTVGSGGLALPVLPSFAILLTLSLLLVSACILVNSMRLNRTGPLEYLILISLCALPAAFGRADAGHMFMSTLGAFIASWTVLSYHRLSGKWMFWSYALGALTLPIAIYQSNGIVMIPVKLALFAPGNPHPEFRKIALRGLNRAFGPVKTQAELDKWRRAFPVVVDDWNVPTVHPLFAPLGYPSTETLTGRLPAIEEGRYMGVSLVMQSDQVQEKIDELRAHHDQLLLFPADASCATQTTALSASQIAADNAEQRRQLRLDLIPFFVPHVRHSVDTLAPLCAYITSHYAPAPYIAPFADAQIWQRTDMSDVQQP